MIVQIVKHIPYASYWQRLAKRMTYTCCRFGWSYGTNVSNTDVCGSGLVLPALSTQVSGTCDGVMLDELDS